MESNKIVRVTRIDSYDKKTIVIGLAIGSSYEDSEVFIKRDFYGGSKFYQHVDETDPLNYIKGPFVDDLKDKIGLYNRVTRRQLELAEEIIDNLHNTLV